MQRLPTDWLENLTQYFQGREMTPNAVAHAIKFYAVWLFTAHAELIAFTEWCSDLEKEGQAAFKDKEEISRGI